MIAVTILLIMLLIFPPSGLAATYWVAPTGAAAWGSCVGSTPLSGASACPVATAFSSAVAGDLVYFRGGTYTVPQRNTGDGYGVYYTVANSGTAGNEITFQAYTGETPTFNGTTGGSGDNLVDQSTGTIAQIMGVGLGKSYITFSGLTLTANSGTYAGAMVIGGDGNNYPGPYDTHHITVQNMTFADHSGLTTTIDNIQQLRVESTHDVTVKNNYFGKHRSATDYPNTSGIKEYHDTNLIIEHNEFSDQTAAIYMKSGSLDSTIRYNYIHNSNVGLHIVTNLYVHINLHVYHNLITYSAYNPVEFTCADDALPSGECNRDGQFYNNTVYGTSTLGDNTVILGGITGTTVGITNFQIYNNLWQQQGGNYGSATLRTSFPTSGGLTTLDYNNYGSYTGLHSYVAGGSRTTSNSLANLKAINPLYNLASANHDQHSLATAPTFVNGSGNLNQIADFALSAASAGYHAGSDGLDMGVDVALVGISGSSVTPNKFRLSLKLKGVSYDYSSDLWPLRVSRPVVRVAGVQSFN